MRKKAYIGTAVGTVVTALLLVILWPAGDPLAGVETVAIVGDPTAADAVLTIKDVRVDRVELLIEQGRVLGRLSATCTVTDVRTGKAQVMDFYLAYLALENGQVRADLVPRKFWQFWKQT
ncbi:MAG: hypothetical protein NUV94_04550 [Candidatus Acetothermia bacterium]|jgi:hypothetical protein|nr:hypothetical protein [Candidatus Acetothermia bacterium]